MYLLHNNLDTFRLLVFLHLGICITFHRLFDVEAHSHDWQISLSPKTTTFTSHVSKYFSFGDLLEVEHTLNGHINRTSSLFEDDCLPGGRFPGQWVSIFVVYYACRRLDENDGNLSWLGCQTIQLSFHRSLQLIFSRIYSHPIHIRQELSWVHSCRTTLRPSVALYMSQRLYRWKHDPNLGWKSRTG